MHLGQYEFNFFGLIGAPGTFQGAMNTTLAPGLRRFVIVFFDDILVYGHTFEDHLEHLALVCSWLAVDKWKIQVVQMHICAAIHFLPGAHNQ